MKKRLLVKSLAIVPLAATVVVANSCKLIKNIFPPIPPAKPLPKPDNSNKPENNNGEVELEQSNEYFEFNGLKYRVAAEDVLDSKKLDKEFNADFFLKDDENSFKKYVPIVENYKKADLNFGVFPTIGNMSYLIRRISPLKIKKIVKNREEFNVLIKKIKSQKEKVSEFFTKEFKAFFKDLYNRHYEDILRIGEGIDFGKKIVDGGLITWKEIPLFESKRRNLAGDRIAPVNLWKLNRDIYDGYAHDETCFDNEMFLSSEFFEKTIDTSKYDLDIGFLDYHYRNKSKTLQMSQKLMRVLDAYVDYLEFISDGNRVNDENKTLLEQLDTQEFNNMLDKFNDAILDYIKLERLMGFSAESRGELRLQLFPGSSNFKTELGIDFRDAYKWMLEIQNKLIAPMFWMKSEGYYYYYSEHLNNNFKNEHIKKYEFIWKNIKQFEKVERPTPISKNHVEANLSVIKQIFEKDLEWKFKE